jgi:hypothetical protein
MDKARNQAAEFHERFRSMLRKALFGQTSLAVASFVNQGGFGVQPRAYRYRSQVVI